MKISELKSAIREMIVSELNEAEFPVKYLQMIAKALNVS
jgi:hypothetical protein